MTLGIGLPWQWAESDPGYYARALALLGYPHWYNWQASAAQLSLLQVEA